MILHYQNNVVWLFKNIILLDSFLIFYNFNQYKNIKTVSGYEGKK